MNQLLAALAASIVRALADWARDWIKAEKAERDAWARRALEMQRDSVQASKLREDALAEAARQAKPPATPAAWSAPRALPLVALASCLLAAGCGRTVYAEPRLAILPEPARPALPAEPVAWTARESVLVGYVAELEAIIRTYNAQARAHNVQHGY